MPNFVTTASTCCGNAPSNNSFSDCLPRCASMRLPTKPSQTRLPPEPLQSWRAIETAVVKASGAVLARRNDLAQLHHVAGEKKCSAEHVLRTAGHLRDLVDVSDTRCWRQQPRRACKLVERANTSFLTAMVSNTASITRSASLDVLEADHARDQPMRLAAHRRGYRRARGGS